MADAALSPVARQVSGHGRAAALAVVTTVIATHVPVLVAIAANFQHVKFYSHGPLVVLVCGYLAWRQRGLLSALPVAPDYRFLAVLVPLALVPLAGIVNLDMFALPSLLLAALGLVFGIRVVRALAFPVLYAHFALPGLGPLLPVLHDATVGAVGFALAATGVPAYLEGTFVHLPSGQFVIEEGCAGINYFIVGLAVATLSAWLDCVSVRRRLLLVLVGAVSAVVANWVRVFAIIVIGHLTQMQAAVVDDHENFGWLVFMLTTLPAIFFAGRWLREEQPPAAPAPAPREGGATGPWLAALVLAGTLVAASSALTLARRPSGDFAGMLPAPELPGAGRVAAMSPWEPVARRPVATAEGVYRHGDGEVALHVHFYDRGRGGELVSDGLVILDGTAYSALAIRERDVETGGAPLPVREFELLEPAGDRRLAWSWYAVGGRAHAGRNAARLAQAVTAFSGRRDLALVTVSTQCAPDCEGAQRRLAGFVGSTHAALDGYLAGVYAAGKAAD
jgi:EpsI family protein